MRLAILGTRGIPANYGGFETFAEELSKRLVRRGHQVTVYCRSHHVDRQLKEYEGVRLTTLPTLKHKYLDTVVHTFLSAMNAVPTVRSTMFQETVTEPVLWILIGSDLACCGSSELYVSTMRPEA